MDDTKRPGSEDSSPKGRSGPSRKTINPSSEKERRLDVNLYIITVRAGISVTPVTEFCAQFPHAVGQPSVRQFVPRQAGIADAPRARWPRLASSSVITSFP